jgi:uncharacterized protein DUF4129
MLAFLAQRAPPSDARLRSVIDSVFSRPEYRWEQPIDPLAPVRRALRALLQFLYTLRSNAPSLYHLLIGALVLVLVAILAHGAWIAYRTMRADATTESRRIEEHRTVRDAAWYGREAETLAAAGRYAEAIQVDFVRLVLEMDARRLVRFHPSRTPNEYARDPALSPEARRDLADLVRRLYAYAFARVPCGREELRDWRDRASVDRYARA